MNVSFNYYRVICITKRDNFYDVKVRNSVGNNKEEDYIAIGGPRYFGGCRECLLKVESKIDKKSSSM